MKYRIPLPKVGYKIIGEDLPTQVQIDGRLYSVETPWDYLANAKRVCRALPMPAWVVNKDGKCLYRNDACR